MPRPIRIDELKWNVKSLVDLFLKQSKDEYYNKFQGNGLDYTFIDEVISLDNDRTAIHREVDRLDENALTDLEKMFFDVMLKVGMSVDFLPLVTNSLYNSSPEFSQEYLESLPENSLFYTVCDNQVYALPLEQILLGGSNLPLTFYHNQLETKDIVKTAFNSLGVRDLSNLYKVEPGDSDYLIVNSLILGQQNRVDELGWQQVSSAMVELYGKEQIKNILQSAPVGPGEWAPPGNQPVPYYIGNQAHDVIAEYYDTFHETDDVRYNRIPIKSILKDFNALGSSNSSSGLNSKELDAKPDILNLSKKHIFEIKPHAGGAGQAQALAQVAFYTGAFAKAGVIIQPGLPIEPGTAGVLPAPAGYFIFRSTAPGVILYQYFRGEYEPVTVPENVPETEKKWYQWEYWEEVTGLTGAALLIYLIISEGSRLYIPRNLVPVP